MQNVKNPKKIVRLNLIEAPMYPRKSAYKKVIFQKKFGFDTKLRLRKNYFYFILSSLKASFWGFFRT